MNVNRMLSYERVTAADAELPKQHPEHENTTCL